MPVSLLHGYSVRSTDTFFLQYISQEPELWKVDM
jgi:uncharacterized protein (DUF2249 family)